MGRQSKSGFRVQAEKHPFSQGLNEPPWHSLVVAVLLALAAFSVWLHPGVTRPYPGYAVAFGGICAMLAVPALISAHPRSRALFTFQTCLGLLVWLLLSSVSSIDPFRTSQTLASWFAGLGVFCLATLVVSSERRWLSLVVGLASIASLASVHGLLSSGRSVVTSTFSNADTFSVIPLIGFFLSLSLVQRPDARIRLMGQAMQILLALTVVRTGSRAGLLGLLFGLMVVVVAHQFQKEKHRDSALLKRSMAAPIIVAILSLLTGLAAPVVGRIAELKSGADAQGVAMREDVLIHGLTASLARPLLGSGPGTFSLAYQQFRPRDILPEYIYVNVAHNDYVEMAVEFGWPGFALVTILCALVILRGIRLIRHDMAVWEASCLIGAIGAVSAFSLLNFAISVPCCLFWEMLMLGLLHGIPVGLNPRRERHKSLLLLALLLGLCGAWSVYFGTVSESTNRSFQKAQALMDALRWEDALPWLDRAVLSQPKNCNLLTSRGKLKGQIAAFQEDKGKADPAETDYLEAVRCSPRDIKALRSLIAFYLSTRQYEKAEHIIQDLRKAAPYLTAPDGQLYRVLLLQKKYQVAANTIYQGSATEEESKKLLFPLLASLEDEHPGQSVSLLGQWNSKDNDSKYVLKLALRTAAFCLKERRPRAAQRILLFISEKAPKEIEARYLQAEAARQLGDKHGEAEQLLSIINQADIKKPDEQAIVDLALAKWALNQPDFGASGSTLHRLEQRLRERPKSLVLCLLVSECYLRMKKPEQAGEFVSHGLDLSPDEPSLMARMGTCMVDQGLGDLGQGYFDQALKVEPGLLEAKLGKERKPINWAKLEKKLPLEADLGSL